VTSPWKAPAAPPAPGRVPAPALAAARVKEVVTPEGVPLRFTVALAGDRAAAFLLDALAIVGLLLAVGLVLLAFAFGGAPIAADLVGAILLLALFLLRTFYFAFFELTWQGQTPGKRRLRLRAVDARGGPLSAEAILARNLTRELEVFLPAIAIFAPDAVFPGAPGWARLASLVWMVLFGVLPLLNRDRLRVGDLVAGTIVVRTPDAVLLEDLAATRAAAVAAAVPFTDAQLDVYGVYELQVLEGVLRGRGTPGHVDAVRTVAAKIRQKLGWEGPATGDEAFLESFYAALRGRLERRLLLGKRRESKHDVG
jgi:uncharacterized RDD family membrane protein YckC